ncbi:RNase E specificity factor CsrD [Serratia microhaemolytica]|uniref:RNase E specificity factor CsrD n=1 Tax=Serratia microhaemolytica TaxID=2675110 RepID=UPI000FDDCE2A|nr:RNase E specificity factor CsrD [Serratia microhaemolytica]
MRLSTKLSALTSSLVVATLFLVLFGCSYSFFHITQARMERRISVLATTLDQAMLVSSPVQLSNWLPWVMQSLGAVNVEIGTGTSTIFSQKIPLTELLSSTSPVYRTARFGMMHHPGVYVDITYLDPFTSGILSFRSMTAITLSLVFMLVILAGTLYWLRLQAADKDHLERRAKRILNGERDGVFSGSEVEWPVNASAAIDCLLVELAEAREERTRIDTLIRAFAAQDAKTGLNNRLFFNNQLITQLEEEGSHGIVMILRLPDFDTLCEVHGNTQVQEMMYLLVNLLSSFITRHPAALLARYQHSDFAVLLPHRTLKEAESMASQMVHGIGALPSSMLIDRQALLHIGIVAYRSGQTMEQVIDQAEQASRHAALQGENGWYIYDSKVPEKGRGSVKWRTLLEQVLTRGGLRLYLQPVITEQGDVHHRKVNSRIHDGVQELLPTEYLPLIEQFGLAERYDRQYVSRIIPLLSQWPEETLAFGLCISSLRQRSFQRWLRDTLMQCEKSQRRRILIELAEADLCQNIEQLRPILRLLTALGCRIVVSQVGLTVTSIAYIKSLPVELIKLHQSVVRSIDECDENQLFVQSLVGACDAAHSKVFAVGVRTRNEWQTLKARGVLGGEGNFFASPEPIQEGRKKYSRRSRA